MASRSRYDSDEYRRIPLEITDRTLTDDERPRVWLHINRQRREWDAKEKEMVAFSLVNIVGRASAANMLNVTVRDLDKLVEIYQLAEKLTNLAEPGAALTWAREIKNINKNLLTPTVLETILRKINENEITSSKDVRKLRRVLRDPVAKERFLEGQSLARAMDILAPRPPSKAAGMAGDLEELIAALKRHSWTSLLEMRGDKRLLEQVDEAEKLLRDLRKVLA